MELFAVIHDELSGEPLGGVTVEIREKNVHGISRSDGSFYLNSDQIETGDVIMFTSVGYVPVTGKVSDLAAYNITNDYPIVTMLRDTKQLPGVTVTSHKKNYVLLLGLLGLLLIAATSKN